MEGGRSDCGICLLQNTPLYSFSCFQDYFLSCCLETLWTNRRNFTTLIKNLRDILVERAQSWGWCVRQYVSEHHLRWGCIPFKLERSQTICLGEIVSLGKDLQWIFKLVSLLMTLPLNPSRWEYLHIFVFYWLLLTLLAENINRDIWLVESITAWVFLY